MPASSRNRRRGDLSEHPVGIIATSGSNENPNAPSTSGTKRKHSQNENSSTSTKFRGVTRSGNNYRAFIAREGTRYTLGQFTSAEAAAEAWDRASLTLGGTPKNFDEARYELERAKLIDPSYTIDDLRREYGMGAVVKAKSSYRGVMRDMRSGKLRAEIHRDGASLSLGVYESEREAAEAFDRAVLAVKGPNGKTNFSPENYPERLIPKTLEEYRDSLANLKTRKGGGKATSKYEGVRRYVHEWKNGEVTVKWRVELTINGKKKQIGYFKTEEEAAREVERRRFELKQL